MKNKLQSLHITLNELNNEIGAIAIGSWSFGEKLTIQCDYIGLMKFMTEHDLTFTRVDREYTIIDRYIYDRFVYETETFLLHTIVSKGEQGLF